MTIERLAGTIGRTDPRLRFIAGAQLQGLSVQRLLDQPTIRITGTVQERRHQILLIVLIDLLSRLFPRIDIDIDLDVPCAHTLPPGADRLAERIDETRAQSPLVPQPPGPAKITVHIGPGASDADITVDGSEWQCYLGSRPSRLAEPRRDTAVGPFLAACRAAARVHDRLLGMEPAPMPEQTYWSALTHEHATDPLDDPDVPGPDRIDALLIGAGSVGGAAVRCLAFEPQLTGHLGVCDPEVLEERNPYRAILATADAASRSAGKADEVRAALDHHEGLHVDAHRATITEWEHGQAAPVALPLVLVAVDSYEDRERVQDALPVEVVNAAVDRHRVVVSGHEFDNGPCMCCLHMPELLNKEAVRNKLIARATGIPENDVNVMRARRQPLNDAYLRGIEETRKLPAGSLAVYAGRPLDDLYDAALVYGEVEVETDDGSSIAVAAPFVTALAGALLAAEALKRSTPHLASFALGPHGLGTKYEENLHTPEHALIDRIAVVSHLCICQSTRRRRLTRQLHAQLP